MDMATRSKHCRMLGRMVGMVMGGVLSVHAETLSLHFGWEPGWTAEVGFVATQTTTARGVESTDQVRGSYVLTVGSHDLGLLVKTGEISVAGQRGGTEGEPASPAVLRLVAAHAPSYVVSAQGAYLGLTDLGAAQARTVERIRALLSGGQTPEPAAAAAQDIARPLIDEPVLRARVSESWERDIGFWAGTALEVGAWYTLTSTQALPALNNIPVSMTTRFRIARRVPCGEEDPAGCVELQHVSAIDEQDLPAVLERYAASVADADRPAPQIKHLEYSQRATTVADPASLRPYRMRMEQKTVMGMEVDGVLHGGAQTARLVRRFSYRDPGPVSAAPPEAAPSDAEADSAFPAPRPANTREAHRTLILGQ